MTRALLGMVVASAMTLVMTFEVYALPPCPQCQEPNDPYVIQQGGPPCVDKPNPCENYKDWEQIGGGMTCGICFNGFRHRQLGKCKERGCPGCEEGYAPVAYQQYFTCDDWSWDRFLDSFDWADILACIGTGLGCPSCLIGNIRVCLGCVLGLPSCAREVCIALDEACGQCVLDDEAELAPGFGCEE